MKEFAEPPKSVTITPETPVVKFAKVRKNTPIDLVFENSKLTKIYVELKREAKNVYMNIRELKEREKVPDSITYASFEIENVNLSVGNAEIGFKVEKSWLHENNLGKNQIRLCRFSEKWELLETKIASEDENFVYYSAKTPGFSKFAIVALKGIKSTKSTTVPTITSKTNPLPIPKQPGFEGVFAVMGLMVAAYLLRKPKI
jgi:PGF-pre-PGF domain-containing protein